MFRALKFKVDHVTWPRLFRDSLSFKGWDWLWSISICKNSRFEPPFNLGVSGVVNLVGRSVW